MAVAPSSFFHNFINVANIQVPPVAADLATMRAKACQSLKASGPTMAQDIRSHKMIAVFAGHSRQMPIHLNSPELAGGLSIPHRCRTRARAPQVRPAARNPIPAHAT
jgi:hypothetical protein